jgi:septal ring factor EnvC (AmiA/AmiB activator)
MNTSPLKISVFVIAIAALLPMQSLCAKEPPATNPRAPSGPITAPGPNNPVVTGTVDVVKLQLSELKAQIASAQTKIQQQDAKIEELKKEIASQKQEAKFTSTVVTSGVNKMGEELKALTADFKSHTHSFTAGNGSIAAGVLFSGLKQNPNYDITLVTSSGKSGGHTGPPEK